MGNGLGMAGFWRNQDGAVAIVFGVMAIPFMAFAGWGVDYLRLYHVKDFLQVQADSAALNATLENNNWAQLSASVEAIVRSETLRQYGAVGWAEDVSVRVERLPNTEADFRVVASAMVPLAFMNIVPGIPDDQLVQVDATARLTEIKYDYPPPELAELDPEAGDYNRIWMYCFWPDRPASDPALPRRTQMVPIADNGGSNFDFAQVQMSNGHRVPVDAQLREQWDKVMFDYPLGLDGREEGIYRVSHHTQRNYLSMIPDCPSGSYMSYRLENVRFVRGQPAVWDSAGNRFNYYTDSVMVENASGQSVEEYRGLVHPDTGLPVSILETVLCDTLAECVGVSQGGIIPEGTNREPEMTSKACPPGKFMYYGWEDRPPGQQGPANSWTDYAWTDSDYDDIRVIVPCPIPQKADERHVRLIG